MHVATVTYRCAARLRTHPLTTHRMRAWIDLLLMSLTFFLTIIWNVEIGIAVSVVISLLLVVHRSSRTRLTILVSSESSCTPLCSARRLMRWSWTWGLIYHNHAQGRIPGTDRWKPIDENPEAEEDAPGVLIVRIRENLDFGASLNVLFSTSKCPWLNRIHRFLCSEHRTA